MTISTDAFRLNPSAIARYFFLDCERFLRFFAAPKSERKRTGIPERLFDHTPLLQEVLESGLVWEAEVVTKILKGRVHVAKGTEPLTDRRHSVSGTIEAMRKAKVGSYLYQGTLQFLPSFYAAYGIDSDFAHFPDCHPDLIEVREGEGCRLLRVIDVKRGESLQLGYRVQVLLYTLALDLTLKQAGITDAKADLETGGIWLGGQPEPEPFDMRSLRPHIEMFLREGLKGILEPPVADVDWHVSFNCERCSYFDHCRDEMQTTNDVSRLINLTRHGKQHLVQLGVRNLPQLEAFLKLPDADEKLAQCASLAGERHYLEGKLAAFGDDSPHVHQSSAALPIGENISVFCILQREPLSRTSYLAGLLVHAKEDLIGLFSKKVQARLFPSNKPTPCLFLAEKLADVPNHRIEYIRLLHEVLVDIHTFNVGKEWKDQLSLQVYCHTDRDQEQLTEWLLEGLAEPAVAQQALDLLLYFQGPDLILTEDHPGLPIAFPILSLQNALIKLLALPVDVSYTLPEALAAMKSKFNYPRKEYFHYPLYHGIRSDAIHAIWSLGKTEQLDTLAKEARYYLYALRALLWDLRKQVADHLFAWPPKFQLPPRLDITDPVLSRLAFFTQYESVVQCLGLRTQRTEPRSVQAQLGLMVELVAINETDFEVVGSPTMEIDESGFPAWLIVRDNDPGRRAQLQFRDYAHRSKLYCRKSDDLAMVGVEHVVADTEGFPQRLTLKYATAFASNPPKRGERFQLHPRYIDFNSDRIIEYLRELDQSGGNWFVSLVRDPASVARIRRLSTAIEKYAADRESDLSLTDSQLEAYREIRRRRLVAVWGPPGTGKTHFLAAMILALADAYAAQNKPFRVLVTAFTHAAIENVLRKIGELKTTYGGLGGALVAAKVKHWQGDSDPAGEIVNEDRLTRWLAGHAHAVVGATVYSCIKAIKKGGLFNFDLVVLDEASQVRVGEASVPVSLVGKEGRLVLAGDDLQLPPIVQGIYPEVEPGDPMLHRSIFEAVRSRVPDNSPIVRKLLENRRMNDVLTSFAAELLYGRDYVCFDDETAQRRLQLTKTTGLSELCKLCLDPAYPMVVVVLEGVQATGENAVEASLVADLVVALRDHLKSRSGKIYKDDVDFFHDGLFIVSPHRAQIRAIRRELNQRRTWTHSPFVDTVDKMQGQEADAVVISYGVSDPEYALHEAEFIYSVNRLNVSITRARTKSIVCLPRPLLEGMPRVLDSEDAARGLAFMQSIAAEAKRQGESEQVDLDQEVTAWIFRGDQRIEN